MTQRSVTVTVNPVTIEGNFVKMNLSLSVKAPSHELTFTSFDNLEAALDRELEGYSEPIALFFYLPKGTRKPPGFDAFTKTHRYRNVPAEG